MSPDGVRFTGVQRVYRSAAGSVEALHAVDGAFEPGAIGAIVGPSGSGKSTLLRILGGIDAADGGIVTVHGVDVRALRGGALRHFRRETVAFLAQRAVANLIPQLTLREQLGPNGRDHAERVGLLHRIDAVASALSGGEQARAALAVGLSRGTPVVLLDEPTAELDRHAAGLVLAELRTAAAEGRTVIVATHDPELVMLAGSRLELTPPTVAVPHEPHVRDARPDAVIVLDHVTKRYDGA
ncbi:MAG: ABC transporter ATP-binding protein, partial [Gaiellaceae bacterium]